MLERIEFERKVIHLIVGVLIVGLVYLNVIDVRILVLILITGLIISLLALGFRIPFISWVLERYDKASFLPGAIVLYFFIGIIASLVLFEKSIALAAITILTVGDFFSNVIGKRYGKHYFSKGRSFEGSVAGLIAGFFGALIFVDLLSAFIGSLFGMIAEALNLKIDDNIIIPIVAGSVISLL